jgi:predicted AlkP superfamily phosphohydrolase/phosphomutase
MGKVMVIGIDSMDSLLLSKFEKDLPNFRKLKENSPDIRMKSVFPPDSDTAWASIYTGLNPAKHGVVHFVDPLEKSFALQTQEIDNSTIKGNTFWDFAGKHNKKVCVLLPHIGYPLWQVNGTMVVRSSIEDEVKSFPESIAENYDLLKLNGIKGVPSRSEKSFKTLIKAHKRLIFNEIEFSLKMLRADDWDLFFTYSSSLDAIQHYFWNYCDETDPTQPRNNPFKSVINDFYILYDKMMGKLMSAVDSDIITIVLSDHGHGRRPLKVLNINEVLRRHNLLVTKSSPEINITEKMKQTTIKLVGRYNLGWLASKALKIVPAAKKIYSRPLSIDWNSTLAYTTDLSGIKAYTYGGIRIKKDGVEPSEYENLRSDIINSISAIRDPKTNKKIVEWICKREDIYQGKFISRYPDIALQLREEYGVGQSVDTSIIGDSYISNVVPGSHKGDTPIFFVSNLDYAENYQKEITLMDIAPTVLDILGIKRKFGFDGKSILAK